MTDTDETTTIVLIDDDPAIRAIAALALGRDRGFRLICATGGRDGIEVTHRRQPDAILLDQEMPDLDGRAVLEKLRADGTFKVPVIFLTATRDSVELQRCLDAGAAGLIAKPFDPRTLANEVREILGLRNRTAESAADTTEDGFTRLRQRFLDTGATAGRRMLERLASGSAMDGLSELIHRWVGRGGTLGYPEISACALHLQDLLSRDLGEVTGQVRDGLARIVEVFETSSPLEPAALPATEHAILPPAVDAVAPPRHEVVASGAPDGPDVLSGKEFAAVGFQRTDLERITSALGHRNVRVHAVPNTGPGAEGPGADLVIVNLAGEAAESPWLAATTLDGYDKPVLLLGHLGLFRTHVPIAGQCAFVLAPWRGEEVVLRCVHLLAQSTQRVVAASRSVTPDDLTIVIGDDDPTITALLEMTLTNHGMSCRVAHKGGDALALIESVRPHAVVLDINMPQLDGFEVLAAIRQGATTSALPVILLTARGQEADIMRGFSLGADDYVVKPFNPMELVARLRRLFRKVA